MAKPNRPAGNYGGRPADLPPDIEPKVVDALRCPSCDRAVFAWPPRAGKVVWRMACGSCPPVRPAEVYRRRPPT